MATERRYTANEALELLLMNDDDFREATITLLPPGDGQQSDEDSGDEEQSEFHQLSRNQLLAEADLCVDYGSHIVSTLADDVEVAVMQQPRRSSRLRASDPDEESELDVSADLWGNGDGEDPGHRRPEESDPAFFMPLIDLRILPDRVNNFFRFGVPPYLQHNSDYYIESSACKRDKLREALSSRDEEEKEETARMTEM